MDKWKNNKFLLILVCLLHQNCETDAIICYKCNSLSSADCAMSLDGSDLPIEECQQSLQCVMSIVNSVTYRGCGSDTPILGATYKKSCANNLCNKGVFPPGRLKCHQCSDETCRAEPSNRSHPCRHYEENDACFTEILETKEVFRGCRSDSNHTRTGDTVFCEINGCNDEEAIRTLRCAECNSQESIGCKINLVQLPSDKCNITEYTTCEMDSLLTKPEYCYTYNNLDVVIRGCSNDIPKNLDSDHLEFCDHRDYCNENCTEQQRCYECNSKDNSQCLLNATLLSAQFCSSSEDSSCFACEYKNFDMLRGCGSIPLDDQIQRCYSCSNEIGCNSKNFRSCYQCSSDVDSTCETWNFPNVPNIEDCSDPENACITKILENGILVRGCESESLNCTTSSSTECFRCTDSFCNKNIFPPDRLKCYQCSNSEDCNALTLNSKPCPLTETEPLSSLQGCLEYIDSSSGNMIRGCRSDPNLLYYCLLEPNVSKCKICYEDDCNNSPAAESAVLSCFHCDVSDFTCQGNQLVGGELKSCQNNYPFGERESCFVTKHFNGLVSRGCTFDRKLNEYDPVWDTTNYCYSSGCNSPATTVNSNQIGGPFLAIN